MKFNLVNTMFSFMLIAVAAATKDCITRSEFDSLVAQYKVKSESISYIFVYTVEYSHEIDEITQSAIALNNQEIIYNCYKKDDSNSDASLIGSVNRQPAYFKQVDLIISILEPNKVNILRYAKLTAKLLMDYLNKLQEVRANANFQSKFLFYNYFRFSAKSI